MKNNEFHTATNPCLHCSHDALTTMTFTPVPAVKARAIARGNPNSRWPTRGAPENNLYPNCSPTFTGMFTLEEKELFIPMGSCLANHLREVLAVNGLSEEKHFPELIVEGLPKRAGIGAVLSKYTPPTLYQELAYALDEKSRERQSRMIVEGEEGRFHDLCLPGWLPGVDQTYAHDRRRRINQYFRKIAQGTAVLLEPSSIECWWDRKTGEYLASAPNPNLVQRYPGRYAFKLLTIQECREWLEKCVGLIREVNPGAKIILAVSPEALDRTYLGEDVIPANTYGKAVLRAVVGEMHLAGERLDYFPSYEMATLSRNENTWRDNQRHIRIPKMEEISGRFITAYYKEYARQLEAEKRTHTEALSALASGDAEQAYQLLQSIRRDHATTTYLNDLAKACEKSGRDAEALDLHALMDERGDRRAPRRLRMANCAVRLKDHDVAIQIAKEILAEHPAYPGAEMVLVETYRQSGNQALAIALARDLTRRISADPNPCNIPVGILRRLEMSLKRFDLPGEARLVNEIATRCT